MGPPLQVLAAIQRLNPQGLPKVAASTRCRCSAPARRQGRHGPALPPSRPPTSDLSQLSKTSGAGPACTGPSCPIHPSLRACSHSLPPHSAPLPPGSAPAACCLLLRAPFLSFSRLWSVRPKTGRLPGCRGLPAACLPPCPLPPPRPQAAGRASAYLPVSLRYMIMSWIDVITSCTPTYTRHYQLHPHIHNTHKQAHIQRRQHRQSEGGKAREVGGGRLD